MRLPLSLFICMVSLAAPALCIAQQASGDQAAQAPVSRAKAVFTEAAGLYREGKYKQALSRFQAALALARKPSIIFNIAQCHRQLGNKTEALQQFKAHLREWAIQHPERPSPHQEEIQGQIKRLEAELERDRERERRRRLQVAMKQEEARQHQARQLELGQRHRRKSITAYALFGGSAALLAAAAVVYGVVLPPTLSAHDQYQVAEDPDEISDLRGQVESGQNTLIAGHVLAGLGGVALVYGLVELFTRPELPRASASSPTVSLRPGPTGVVIHGRF